MPGSKKKKNLKPLARSRQKPSRKNKQVKPPKPSKKTSEEAEHGEERYRALIDNSPVCIHEIDMDGNLISMNAAGLAMLDVGDESKVTGMAYLQAVCKKDRERIGKLLDRALKGRSSQFKLTSSGSKPRLFSSCFIPIKSKKGKVVRLMGVTEDITERKRAEETILNRANQQKVVSELGFLALSNIELSELFDKTVNVLAQTLGVEYCKILELLPDAKALLLRSGVGWRRAIVGQTTVGAQKESHAGYTLVSDKPVIVDDSRTETRFSSPALLRDHNVVSGVSVIIKGENRPYGVLGAHTVKRQSFTQDDINFLQSIANILAIAIERKKVEEALREAKEKAESATKEKDKYISLIAHNLKSPFTSIVTLLELLSSEKDDPAIVKHRVLIDAVRDTSEYAMKVIDDVLRVSRFESGKIKLKPGFMDGNIEALTVIATHGHLAREKGVGLVNHTPRDIRLFADHSLFREVLSNLAYNAIKFCRKGDTITFYVPSGERSTIAIKDTGSGMDECTLSNIFRHDVKTTSLGTAGERGTGIGLPFCSEIMKAHGGELVAESVKGGGSVFYAKLPYVKPTALIVDDDAVFRRALDERLEKIDVNVIEAENEEGAFEALKKDSPHLILLGARLQNGEGFAILKRLKADKDYGNIPVIVVMAADQTETREKAISLGADDFISKQANQEEFVAIVRKFVA